MNRDTQVKMLSTVAQGLHGLKEPVVFLGGAAIGLYITDPAAPDMRPTDDVDCVVEIVSLTHYHKLEEKLRRLGFKHPIGEDHPICRWEYRGILVDVMPTEESVLGFSNRWYKEGIRSPETIRLPDGTNLEVFSLPYLLATKFEAFKTRGGGDFLASHDIEDIVSLVDGCGELSEKIRSCTTDVRSYLRAEIKALLKNGHFVESVHAHIESANPGTRGQRAERALSVLKEISDLA